MGLYPGGFPSGSAGEESVCNAEVPSLILGLGRPPEAGNGHPLQCSRLENPTDGGPWRLTVQGAPTTDTT